MRAVRQLESTAYGEILKGFGMFSLDKRRQRGDMVIRERVKQREKK